jgi:hypothetical protein
MDTPNRFLVVAAALSAIAALLHVAIIFFGPSWYRFFGAGERMVALAAAGNWRATVITLCIALVLASWSLFALSGAGVIPPLPLLKPALCLITGIYLLRGLAPLIFFARPGFTPFWLWSSLICCVYGAVYLVGLSQVWTRL